MSAKTAICQNFVCIRHLHNTIKSKIFYDMPILQIDYEIKEDSRQAYKRTRTISRGTKKIRSWLQI
jgi:hypothetical protein